MQFSHELTRMITNKETDERPTSNVQRPTSNMEFCHFKGILNNTWREQI